MEIKTNRSRETINARVVPPPDKASLARKKAGRKLGKNHVAGRRFVSVLKTLGKIGAFLLLIVFMLSVFVFAYTSEKFNLRHVTVYGCKELDQRDLEKVVRPRLHEITVLVEMHLGHLGLSVPAVDVVDANIIGGNGVRLYGVKFQP